MRKISAVTLAASVALAGAAQAESYRVTQWQPDTEITVIETKWFTDEITKATGGALEFETFTNGALVPAKATLQGVADGVAQMGFAYSGYTPSDTPITESVSAFAFLVDNPEIAALAYVDFVMTDPAANGEWLKLGVLPLGGWATARYELLCNTPPLSTMADLNGKRVRMPGGSLSDFGTAIGLIPVNMPASEAYQAQQTGAVDCGAFRLGSLSAASLHEVTKSVTLVHAGYTFASPSTVVNQAFWKGLTPEQRRIIVDLNARFTARQIIAFHDEDTPNLELAKAENIALVEPAADVQAAIAAFKESLRGKLVEGAKGRGVENPEAVIDAFQARVDKWTEIVGKLQDPLNEDALTAAIAANLTDGIDSEAYGMN